MPLDEPALIGAVGVAWVWVVLTDFGVGIWPVRVVHRPRDRRPEFPQEPETDLVSPAPRAPPLNRREEEEEEEGRRRTAKTSCGGGGSGAAANGPLRKVRRTRRGGCTVRW